MEMERGTFSYELREDLGIPDVASPPYIQNMQRYGSPLSYPNLKIPGFNAPIPEEAGKLHVDNAERVHKTRHWGDLEEAEDQIEEEELEAGIDSVEPVDAPPSILTGIETAAVVDLRKQQRKEPDRTLYQVLEEKEERSASGTFLGATRANVINIGTQDKTRVKRVDLLKGQKTDRVDAILQPVELEVMDNVLPAKYEEAKQETKLHSQREDFSDMVAENEKKRKRQMQEKEGKLKKNLKF